MPANTLIIKYNAVSQLPFHLRPTLGEDTCVGEEKYVKEVL